MAPPASGIAPTATLTPEAATTPTTTPSHSLRELRERSMCPSPSARVRPLAGGRPPRDGPRVPFRSALAGLLRQREGRLPREARLRRRLRRPGRCDAHAGGVGRRVQRPARVVLDRRQPRVAARGGMRLEREGVPAARQRGRVPAAADRRLAGRTREEGTADVGVRDVERRRDDLVAGDGGAVARGPLRPRGALRSHRAGVTLRALRTLRSLRAGIALRALCSGVALVALRALSAGCARGPGRARVALRAGVALVALEPLRAGRAGGAGVALRSLRAGRALRARGAGGAGVALRPLRARDALRPLHALLVPVERRLGADAVAELRIRRVRDAELAVRLVVTGVNHATRVRDRAERRARAERHRHGCCDTEPDPPGTVETHRVLPCRGERDSTFV